MSELQTVDLSLFYFYFLFLLIFYFEKLGLEFSMILHITVTNSHMTRPSITHQSHSTIEDSRRF